MKKLRKNILLFPQTSKSSNLVFKKNRYEATSPALSEDTCQLIGKKLDHFPNTPDHQCRLVGYYQSEFP